MSGGAKARCDAMTPEEALRNILKLVEVSDELEDAHAMQILLQSIKTLAEKGLGRHEDAVTHEIHEGRMIPKPAK
jgi:hypothetical protein